MIVNTAAHQGDVYVKANALPKNAVLQEKSKVILAYGEVTGHKHQFIDDNVLDYTIDNRRFIKIVENPATLYHEEHDPITFDVGTYEVFIARQWTDDNEPIVVVD